MMLVVPLRVVWYQPFIHIRSPAVDDAELVF